MPNAETYTALGQLARVQGRPDEAETLFLRGAALAQGIGHLWHEGSSYWLAAKVALDRGDAAVALDRLRDALKLMVAEGDRTSTLVGLHTLASAIAMKPTSGCCGIPTTPPAATTRASSCGSRRTAPAP